ncbi:hypothetical protein MHYP_G00258080 [Metynnis hypsauchen]
MKLRVTAGRSTLTDGGDGGRSAYRNWATGQPRSSADCVYLRKGKWYSYPCSNTQPAALCSNTLIHVSAEQMDWASALDYSQRENRRAILRIESDLDQKEVGFELRRRRVSGPLWVGLGQSGLSELLKSSSRLSLGAWTKRSEGLRPSAVPGPTLWRKHSGRRRTFQLLELFVNLKNRRGAISDPRSGQFTVL